MRNLWSQMHFIGLFIHFMYLHSQLFLVSFRVQWGGGKFKKYVFPILEIILYGSFLWNIFAGNEISIEAVFTPAYHLWYLMSLVWWRLLVSLFHERIGMFILIISIILSIMSGKIIGTDILSIGMRIKV